MPLKSNDPAALNEPKEFAMYSIGLIGPIQTM